jgi:nucleotide-binding universal stress UspA family protein
MFKKILLPLDGSTAAEQAVFWAKQYARPSKAQVVLLQVLHTEYPLKGMPFRAGSPEARLYLQGIERELNFSGIPCKIMLGGEPVARSIVETAYTERCDLIIMTSRGASKVVRWLIGGVAQQVMRLSPIPLLILRGPIAGSVHAPPKRILLPQDGSPLARTILPWGVRLARLHRASLGLLHVRGQESPDSAAGPGLSRLSSQLRARGLKVTVSLDRGDPAEQILKACRKGDLLAMTTHGRGGLKRLLLGSVAEKIVPLAPVPVMIYKRFAKSRRQPHDLEMIDLMNP